MRNKLKDANTAPNGYLALTNCFFYYKKIFATKYFLGDGTFVA